MNTESDPSSAPDPQERALEKARHFNDSRQWVRAEQAAREGLARDPAHLEFAFEFARSLVGRERWQDAEESLKQALATDAEYGPALLLLGIVETQSARYVEAEQHLLAVLRLAPTWAYVYVAYGDLMERTGHASKAEKLWRKALELDPESADAHQRLALHHAEGIRGARATAHAQAGLSLAPEDIGGHVSLAAAQILAGRPFAARALLRDALRLDPSNADLEEAWLQADRCCRWIYLPAYYFGIATARLPGKQFLVWGVFVALSIAARRLQWPPELWVPVALTYLLFCIYTWIAEPLVGLWTRLVPPKL